jgi:hypothetical protein
MILATSRPSVKKILSIFYGTRPRGRFEGPHDLRLVGEPAGVPLGEDQGAVDGHLEHPPVRGHQLQRSDPPFVRFEQAGCQTDSLRLVVSDRAVF